MLRLRTRFFRFPVPSSQSASDSSSDSAYVTEDIESGLGLRLGEPREPKSTAESLKRRHLPQSVL